MARLKAVGRIAVLLAGALLPGGSVLGGVGRHLCGIAGFLGAGWQHAVCFSQGSAQCQALHSKSSSQSKCVGSGWAWTDRHSASCTPATTRLHNKNGQTKAVVFAGSTLPSSWHRLKCQLPPAATLRRFTADPRRLTRDLSGATSALEVLSVLEVELENPIFNEVHVATAFHRLARFSSSFTPSMVASQEFQGLQTRLIDMMERDYLGPHAVANILWAVANLQSQVPQLKELLPKLIENASYRAASMTEQAVANTMWASASLSLDSTQLQAFLPQISERLVDRADELNAQGIANCIWASARLKTDTLEFPDEIVISVLAEMAREKLEDFKAQEISNIVWSAAILREVAPELLAGLAQGDVLHDLAKRSMSLMQTFGPQSIANAAWGFAFCGCNDTEFMSDAASHFVRLMPRMVRQVLAKSAPMMLNAFALLGIRNSYLLAVIATEFPPLLKRTTDWGLGSLTWSYSKLDRGRLFASFQDQLAKEARRRGFSDEDVESCQLGPRDWNRAAGEKRRSED
ncbi:unnamed protein product [Polarella glacialis]|uniref:RNA-editing substrate-binding complex 6 protein domain-containing protein n=1 Tax=Polarella glacialis TaxID=89957 RepID=A0A813JX76_POLGL|nr:unnamed protein product [Polarella glacialis]